MQDARQCRDRLRTKIGGALGAALIVLVLTGIAAAPALGSTWTGRQLSGEAAKVTMFGMSCPSASLCVAVGGNNTIASSTSSGADSWTAVYVGEGAIPTGFNYRQIRGVSCPSAGLCVAVSQEGLIYTSTNPTGSADAWSVADLSGSGPNVHLYGVSCPTTSFCLAAAGKGEILTSTNPTGGASAWTVTQLPPPLEVRGVSCTLGLLCVAVGDNGERANPTSAANGEILSTTNPLGGVWQRVAMPGAQGPLYGVSCPAVTLCVSGQPARQPPRLDQPHRRGLGLAGHRWGRRGADHRRLLSRAPRNASPPITTATSSPRPTRPAA